MENDKKISEDKYVSTAIALKKLGIKSVLTLHNWESTGKIDTIRTGGGHRLYNIEKYIRENNKNEKKEIKITNEENKESKENVCYIRVQSVTSKNLKSQREFMKNKYPNHKIIEDIGYFNFEKKGIKKILEMLIKSEIKELILSNKNNLSTDGMDLFNYLIKKTGGNIIIDGPEDNNTTKDFIDEILIIINSSTEKLIELKNSL